MDLRLLPAEHLRLLEIARQLGMETFGVGTLSASMTTDDLSGLRLVSQRDLTETMKAVAGAEISQLQAPIQTAAPAAEPPVRLTPARPVDAVAETDGAFVSDEAGQATRDSESAPPEATPIEDAADANEPLLTPEELDALLGGEQ